MGSYQSMPVENMNNPFSSYPSRDVPAALKRAFVAFDALLQDPASFGELQSLEHPPEHKKARLISGLKKVIARGLVMAKTNGSISRVSSVSPQNSSKFPA